MTQATGGYTTDEISSVTSSLVQTSVSYQTDSLGTRQTSVTFDDFQQAAIGVFLLFPTAWAYTVQLGCSRLNESLQTQATNVANLLTLVQAAGRVVQPVSNTAALSNASAALFALQGAASSRTSAFSSVATTPAFQNFSNSVDSFLKSNGPSVVSSGQVVPAPQDAKSQIQTLVPQLVTAQQSLISTATDLSNALTDYNSADLPAVATSSTISNATQNIANLVLQLEGQTPTQQLASLKDTVLQLLAARAVVAQMGGFSPPGSFFPFTGTGTPYSDTTHAANPASLPSTLYAPYNIQGTPALTVTLDGAAPQTANINNGLFAEMSGSITEPFTITGPVEATVEGTIAGPFTFTSGVNTQLLFTVLLPNAPLVQVSLTTTLTGSQTTAALVTDLTTQLNNNYPSLVGLYAFSSTSGNLTIAATTAASGYGITIGAGTMNSTVGLTSGQYSSGSDDDHVLAVTVTNLTNNVSNLYPKSFTLGTFSAAAIAAEFNGYAFLEGDVEGPFTVTPGETFNFTVTSPTTTVAITTTLTGPQSATALASDLNAQLALHYPSLVGVYEIVAISSTFLAVQSVNPASYYSITLAAGTLNSIVGLTTGETSSGGIPLPFTAYAQGSVGSQFVDIRYSGSSPAPTFQASITFPSADNPMATKLGFTTDYAVQAQPGTARSVAANLNQLFLNPALNATVAVDATTQGSNINIRSDTSDPSTFVAYLATGAGTAVGAGTGITVNTQPGLIAAGVVVGNVIVIRTGANANTKWTITSMTDSSVTASAGSTSVSGSCTYEIGPAFSSLTPGYVIQISSGINKGIYTITQKGPTSLAVPFELKVNAIIHGFAQPNGLPYVTTGTVGQEKVVFNSSNVTVSSSVALSGAAVTNFFSSTPATAVGTTPWLQLSAQVAGLGVGDSISYYNTHYNIPDDTYQITSLTNNTLLGLATPISDTLVLNFNDAVPPPFALLESGAYKAFEALSTLLTTWIDQQANQATFFASLTLAMNVIINEGQPTATQINTAINLLTQLQNILVQASSATPDLTLEFALDSYTVNRVPAIDSLIQTYTAKGSTKAVDTLLMGQFAEFFGLDQDGVSYAGAMQSQVRSIAQNDLPVRKVDRTSTVTSPVTGTAQSPDFEYDQSDIDTTTAPDFPTQFDQVSPTTQNNP